MSDDIRPEDREEAELAEADRLAHCLYGPDEDIWPEQARSGYFDTLLSIHAWYAHAEFKEAA